MNKLMTSFLLLCTLVLIAGTPQPAGESFTNSLGMKMIRVEPGTFRMGRDGSRDLWMEQPAHQVTLTQPFYIAESEITVEQFRHFQGDFQGTPEFHPYAGGVSWNEAQAFAEWLSQKEGKTYRLPTEAEWEYVAKVNEPYAWGIKNLLTGAREWCQDWFGEYSSEDQIDPVGPESGYTRVVKGGPLDSDERNFLEIDFRRPESRLAMPPSFGLHRSASDSDQGMVDSGLRPGLIGVWYENTDFTEPQETTALTRVNNDWNNDPRGGGDWSARWRGHIRAPFTGEVIFEAEAVDGLLFEIDGKNVINGLTDRQARSGTATMVQDRSYPVVLSFSKDQGSLLRIYWRWPGQVRKLIPEDRLFYGEQEERLARSEARKDVVPGYHAIGFRLVQAPVPVTLPTRYIPPAVQQGVKQDDAFVQQGPSPSEPYFRKRYMLPTPPENSPGEVIDLMGMHPSFREHNHSPALEVLPNGDLLMIIFTSYKEYEPGVSLIANRLRFGAEQWDMPSPMFDLVGVNDVASLLWTDKDTVHLFWGSPKLEMGAFPFQWTSSRDSGATWTEVTFPNFRGAIGGHTRQPINSAFRDSTGTMYVASDGSGGESVLWASRDNGATWYDTGGRSAGRHTTYVPLKNGRILGMGGKNTHIDEFMPRAISKDGGATWEVSKTPFSRLGTNQRPTIIRLQSGRLFFAGDFIHNSTGTQPKGLSNLGCYVALSNDEGENWFIRKLPGAQLHEFRQSAERMKGPTLGYAVARQAPNGLIHLISTMNNPCLHFEFNEAWILDGEASERPASELMATTAHRIDTVEHYREDYADGKARIVWDGGVADDGRFLLHGVETWYYADGQKQREATYQLGRKVGTETGWSPEGHVLYRWVHHPDGLSLWTQFWSNGQKKAESSWQDFHAEGTARRWDSSGNLVAEGTFRRGRSEDRVD